MSSHLCLIWTLITVEATNMLTHQSKWEETVFSFHVVNRSRRFNGFSHIHWLCTPGMYRTSWTFMIICADFLCMTYTQRQNYVRTSKFWGYVGGCLLYCRLALQPRLPHYQDSCSDDGGSRDLWTWHWQSHTSLHGATVQKTAINIRTYLKTSSIRSVTCHLLYIFIYSPFLTIILSHLTPCNLYYWMNEHKNWSVTSVPCSLLNCV